MHAALRDGIAALPRGFMIVVLSRASPPPALARMCVNDQLMLLGWEELRLTLDEIKDMNALIRPTASCAPRRRCCTKRRKAGPVDSS